MMTTKYLCLNCNSSIRKHLVDKQLNAGISIEMVKCPECGKEFVAERGKKVERWNIHRPHWRDKTWSNDYCMHEAVSVRNFRKLVVSGQLFNGMPLIERGDHVWKWDYNSIRKCWNWKPLVKTRSAFLRGYIYKRTYSIAYWTFEVVAAHKNSEAQQINVALDRQEKWKDLDFSAVITEVKKYGFNVSTEFLSEQVENIRTGVKQNRFLPDRSGQIFSPSYLNGMQFRFSRICDTDSEYIC